MRHYIRSITFLLISLVLLAVSSCKEENDFIPEPTPTSIIISGRVTTTDGAPLADIPLSVDYKESQYLGYQKTIHKAKAVSDAQGYYRVFFEPEKNTDDSDVFKTYNLYADLSGLSVQEYILPSDFDDSSQDETLLIRSYSDFNAGQTFETDVYIPRKKPLTVRLTNYESRGRLLVFNTTNYGNDRIQLTFPVELTSSGEGTVVVNCALEEINLLTVGREIGDSLDSREIFVTRESNEVVIFDNKQTPDEYKFKITKTSHLSVMNEEYPLPAPFDLITFRITDAKGTYDPLKLSAYTHYYDSIVWSAAELPDTKKIYYKKADSQSAEEHFTSQWSSYFYKSGSIKNYLKGYRGGTVVHADSIRFDLYERDFLCFDWENGNVSLTGRYAGIYCYLNTKYEYQVKHTQEIHGTRYVEIRAFNSGKLNSQLFLTVSQAALRTLLKENEGEGQSCTGKSDAFECLPDGVEPVQYWENAATRILLLHTLPSDTAPEEYYIHAEAK